MAKICPERIVRAASITTNGDNPSIIQLLDSPYTANLERIVCNVHEPVLLRLLVCKEENSSKKPDDCSYPDQKNMNANKRACSDSKDKLAHVYVRHEKWNAKARSCVLVFVEGKYLSNTNELFKIFQNTVNWLNIAQEMPYFYVFRYGQPQVFLTTIDAGKKLNQKMRETFNGYPKGEDICIMHSVEYGAEPLIINCAQKFFFRAS